MDFNTSISNNNFQVAILRLVLLFPLLYEIIFYTLLNPYISKNKSLIYTVSLLSFYALTFFAINTGMIMFLVSYLIASNKLLTKRGNYGLTDKQLIIHYVIISYSLSISSFFISSTITKIEIEFFSIIIAIFVSYTPSALSKLKSSKKNFFPWLFVKHFKFQYAGCFIRKSIPFWRNHNKDFLFNFFNKFNFCILIVGLMLESTFLVFFYKESLIIHLILLSAFHILVFVITGILFWKWLVFNISVSVFILTFDYAFTSNIELFEITILTTLCILYGELNQNLPKLTWICHPFFIVENFVILYKNKRIPLEKKYLGPLNIHFSCAKIHRHIFHHDTIKMFDSNIDLSIEQDISGLDSNKFKNNNLTINVSSLDYLEELKNALIKYINTVKSILPTLKPIVLTLLPLHLYSEENSEREFKNFLYDDTSVKSSDLTLILNFQVYNLNEFTKTNCLVLDRSFEV